MALEVTCSAPRAAGLDAAHRVVRAAALATAAGHDRLPWATLRTWPEWAWVEGDAPTHPNSPPHPQAHGTHTAPPPWLLTLGALRHAAAWQQCIEGRCLQALRSLIGSVAFDAVMQQPVLADPGAPALPLALRAPGSAALATALLATGRDVAAIAIDDPALQAAVMAVLHGHSSPAARTTDGASSASPGLSAATAAALQRQAMDLHPMSAEGQR